MPQEHKNNLLWQSSSTPERLRQRAALIKQIREFFEQRNVLEVETPSLSQTTITDIHLEAMQTEHRLPGHSGPQPLFLQTSPEFAMKRLLCDGFGDIFQLCKCFRVDEIGSLHNPEFTMLEWYRVGFSMQNLIDEVGDLLKTILGVKGLQQLSYDQVFQEYLQISVNNLDVNSLIDISVHYSLRDYVEQLRQSKLSDLALKDAILQVLFSQEIEPQIGNEHPVCITHFPASQASLAKINDDGSAALRFEVYYKQIELANGFEELSDADVQRQRFEQDNVERTAAGKLQKDIDTRLLAALEHGLPSCSGVALGVDRLIMLALECSSISEVVSFDISRA